MNPSHPTGREQLATAAQALRQVLLRLDHYAKNRVQHLDPSARYAESTMSHVRDLDALITAVQQYDGAVTVCLNEPTAPPVWAATARPTPAQLLAEREADPVYRLGYVRGYYRGYQLGQQPAEQALSLYAQHADLPLPPAAPSTGYAALVARTRAFLAELTQRYGAGSLPRHQPPSRRYGTV